MLDNAASFKLVPLILGHFADFLHKSRSNAFRWELDLEHMRYTVRDDNGTLLANVIIDLVNETHRNNENATGLFNFGFERTPDLQEAQKQAVLGELRALTARMSKLEERLPEIYGRVFPRNEHDLIDWDKCPFTTQALAHKRTENLRLEMYCGDCGLKCVFCSVPLKIENSSPQAVRLQQYEELIRAIFEIGSAVKDDLRLHIISTDPIAHPDIVSLLHFARKAGYAHVGISTAMMHELDGPLLKQLAQAGLKELDIPIYGVSAETSDAVTGRAGHFEHMLNVCRQAHRLNVDIKIHSVALRSNQHELEKIPALAAELGGFFLNFLYVRFHGDHRLPLEHLMPRLSDLPLSVRRRLNLRIPCLEAGADFAQAVGSHLNIEENIRQGKDIHLDSAYEFEFAHKCKGCAKRRECSGVFPPYLELFGDSEFKPF